MFSPSMDCGDKGVEHVVIPKVVKKNNNQTNFNKINFI